MVSVSDSLGSKGLTQQHLEDLKRDTVSIHLITQHHVYLAALIWSQLMNFKAVFRLCQQSSFLCTPLGVLAAIGAMQIINELTG